MAVSTTANKVVYTGDGVTVDFNVTFDNEGSGELRVFEVDPSDIRSQPAEKTKGVHWQFNTSPDRVTCILGYVPASGVELHIERDTADTQGVTLPSSGPFPPESVEEGLDRGVLIAQDNAAGSIPAVYPVGDSGSSASITTSDQAVYVSAPIAARPGTSGTLVSAFGFIWAQWSVVPDPGESVVVGVRNGPLGTTGDPSESSHVRVFPVRTDAVYAPCPVAYTHLRVDDGDMLTFTVRRTTSTGTVNVTPTFGGVQILPVGSY